MRNLIPLLMPCCLMVLVFFSCEEPEEVLLDDQIPTKNFNLTSTSTCTIDAEDFCTRTRKLIAGQNCEVGTVKVYCTPNGTFKVQYLVDDGYSISEVHVAAGTEEELPINGGGCPKIGNFPFKLEGLNNTSVCLDIGAQDAWFLLAAHAVVTGSDYTSCKGEETAWAKGKSFKDCNNWSMLMEVECDDKEQV